GAVAGGHCGWRRLVAGVLEAAVRVVRGRGQGPVRAVIGPCISPAHYEFGADELQHVTRRLGTAVEGRTESGGLALDLRAGVGAALASAGVDAPMDVPASPSAASAPFSNPRDGLTRPQGVIVPAEPCTASAHPLPG